MARPCSAKSTFGQGIISWYYTGRVVTGWCKLQEALFDVGLHVNFRALAHLSYFPINKCKATRHEHVKETYTIFKALKCMYAIHMIYTCSLIWYGCRHVNCSPTYIAIAWRTIPVPDQIAKLAVVYSFSQFIWQAVPDPGPIMHDWFKYLIIFERICLRDASSVILPQGILVHLWMIRVWIIKVGAILFTILNTSPAISFIVFTFGVSGL